MDSDLKAMVAELHPDELHDIVGDLPDAVVEKLVAELGLSEPEAPLPDSPLEQAQALMPSYLVRPHLELLSDVLAEAMEKVEAGESQRLIIQMPPRTGKTTLATTSLAAWTLAKHPDWEIMLTSYSSALATSWTKQIKNWVMEGDLGGHVTIPYDYRKAADWATNAGGTVLAASIGEGITGRGARVLVIDDPLKDFVTAHSKAERERVWNWWLSTSQTRLHPSSLTIVIMTRWHEADLVGKLLDPSLPGDPEDWQVISLPAIAGEDDILGREVGEPLLSPLIDEETESALKRWEDTKENVGSYVWSALYQQRPAPPTGSIFGMDNWRFWTTDPEEVTEDGRTILLPENTASGAWLDSWDFTFKSSTTGDFVVGQRWVRLGPNRYLIAQQRGRWNFTESIEAMRLWAEDDAALSPYGKHVHKRLVEEAANGAAIISTLKSEISGIQPVTVRISKESRARAITPEIESGHVYLPSPRMPGYGWVRELLSELREFPNGTHDDQVDALTQALMGLRGASEAAGISLPKGTLSHGLPGAMGGSRVSGMQTMGRRY